MFGIAAALVTEQEERHTMNTIETKVKASSAAALVSGVVVWLLGKYVLKTGVGAADQALIYAAVPLVLTALAGYFAPHTYRPLPPAPAPVPPAVPPPGTG